MSIQSPERHRPELPPCPVCGQEATSVTESVVRDRLCETAVGGQPDGLMPGQRWRHYEPCGHDA